MASHSYGAMAISGGEVHNGDNVSIIKNHIETALFFSDESMVDVEELVRKLASATQQYEMLRDQLQRFGSRHQNLVNLLHEIEDLQSALSTLQVLVEDPQLEDISTSDDCLPPLLDVSRSLDQYQSLIEDFRTELTLFSASEDKKAAITIRSGHGLDEIRWKLRDLRDKLNNTIVIANICIQRRLQAQSMQHIHELKAMLAVIETDSEHRQLARLPLRLPLKRWDLERAKINDDPELPLRRFFESLTLHRPIDSHPSTPSMQVSSIAPTSTTGIISFVTARERQSSAEVVDDTLAYTLQIFIRGLPHYKSFVLQVNQDDTLGSIKSRINPEIIANDYSFSHHNRLLHDNSVVSENLIRNLDTLSIVPYIRMGQGQLTVRNPTGNTTVYFENNTLAELRNLTVQDLKRAIFETQGIPERFQRLICLSRQLNDWEVLASITSLIHLVVRLSSDTEESDTTTKSVASSGVTSQGTSGLRTRMTRQRRKSTSSQHAAHSSYSSERFGKGRWKFLKSLLFSDSDIKEDIQEPNKVQV